MKVELSNEDKILFPKSKITKGDVISYYKKNARKIVSYMKDRPVSLMRYPNGITKEWFFQKNEPTYFPKWIKTASVKRKGKSNITMVLCNDVDSLVYIANQACITPHIWLSKKDKPNNPDRVIFDLDPPEGKFNLAIKAALLLKEVLEKKLKLPCFVMTTGSNGLHVVIPIKREKEITFDDTREFAKRVARIVVEKEKTEFTLEQRKNKRRGRLFIDCMRNGFAQTVIAPYSIRAIENAPIACPISWKDLQSKKITAQSFNIFSKIKSDPFKGMDKKAKSIKKAINKIESLSN